MEWIYLSPHFDDVALSCGGLVWELSQTGQPVSIWTICGGEPPPGPLSAFAKSLHQRWKTGEQAVARRMAEDIDSCRVLGAGWHHFDLPDCIYRPGGEIGIHYYASEDSLWGEVHTGEAPLIDKFADMLLQGMSPAAQVISPLGLGGHVDHRLTRAMAERLGKHLWYYLDYPYVLNEAKTLAKLQNSGWQSITFEISERGLEAWQESIAAHKSQISTFWRDLDAMRSAIRAYKEQMGGVRLEEIIYSSN